MIQRVDPLLIEAVAENVKELVSGSHLPASEFRQIAREMVQEGRITDGDWAIERIKMSQKDIFRKRNIAKVRGYSPFINLSKRVFSKLNDRFGPEIIDLMRVLLADPEDIYPKWAFRFALAIEKIGFNEVRLHQEDFYEFVTESEVWQEIEETHFQEFQAVMDDGERHELKEAAPATEPEAELPEPIVETSSEEPVAKAAKA